jgi:hypothetical protein
MKNCLQVLSLFRESWLSWSLGLLLVLSIQVVYAGKKADQQVIGKVSADNGEFCQV